MGGAMKVAYVAFMITQLAFLGLVLVGIDRQDVAVLSIISSAIVLVFAVTYILNSDYSWD